MTEDKRQAQENDDMDFEQADRQGGEDRRQKPPAFGTVMMNYGDASSSINGYEPPPNLSYCP